jgi:hypothetical protein
MENTGSLKMNSFFGVQGSPEMDTVIEDTFLRKALIGASIKLETMLKNGGATLQSRIVSNTEWGLEIEIEMFRPKEDKPIIFTYIYRVDRIKFLDWMKNHEYLMGGACLAFICKKGGLQITIPGPGIDKYHKTFANIIVKYSDDENANVQHRPNIVESPVKFLVHREVVNNHDWIVKCVIE